MKNMFKKKRGFNSTPTHPEHYAKQLQIFLGGMSLEDKARIVAATQTEGELELRLRYAADGSQSMSVWLCLPNTDEAIKLVPSDQRAVIPLPRAAP